MPNFCPSCGTKVDEGNKFCLKCGAQLNPESTAETGSSNENISQQLNQQAPPDQSQNKSPGQKKSNINLLIALIAIIAIVIVIVVIIMFTGGGIDNRFVGEWEQDDDLMPISWNFKSDGTFEMMGIGFGKWSVHGNQICITPDLELGDFADDVCYDFEFSNGGNTVSLSIGGSENLVLTKK
jgi:hypothetical protein